MILQQLQALGDTSMIPAEAMPPVLTPPQPMSIAERPFAVVRPGPAHRVTPLRAAARAQPTVPLAAAAPATNRSNTPAPAVSASRPMADNEAALLAQLETRIDAAVARAAVMPDAARRQRREGRARLRFVYQDGAVDGVQVVQSSESRLLDDAAVSAVRGARYPAPPGPMRGRRLDLLVWIDFKVAAEPG